MLLPGHLLTSDWRVAMMRASTKSEVPQVALQDDRKNNADGHCDWEQNLPEFLQESIQAMVSAWISWIVVKNIISGIAITVLCKATSITRR